MRTDADHPTRVRDPAFELLLSHTATLTDEWCSCPRAIAGMGVVIAARVAALAGPSDVWVSRTVTDLVIGSGIHFRDDGNHELKGVPGSWAIFAVTDR